MHGEPATVTNKWLDEAIRKLLPTHMQLIMGIGTAEEIALAEVKAQEQMKATKVLGHDADPQPLTPDVEVRCPVTGAVSTRPRVATDPIVWTEEAWSRLQLVPLIARPLARNTVERFARGHGIWRVTTPVMDDNKQAMIAADEFDVETMMVMFTELRAKQIRAEAEGTGGLSAEMRAFIEEAKAQGITRCPIRDIEEKMGKCPVDFKGTTPDEAKQAVEKLKSTGHLLVFSSVARIGQRVIPCAFASSMNAQGITRCPIRDIEEKMGKCPVDFKGTTPDEAKQALTHLL